MPVVAEPSVQDLQLHELACLVVIALSEEPPSKSRIAQILVKANVRFPRSRPAGGKMLKANEAATAASVDAALNRIRKTTAGLAHDEGNQIDAGLMHAVLAAAPREVLDGIYKVINPSLRLRIPLNAIGARHALYTGNPEVVTKTVEHLTRYIRVKAEQRHQLLRILPFGSPPEAIERLPPSLQEPYLEATLEKGIDSLEAPHPRLQEVFSGQRRAPFLALTSLLYGLRGEDLPAFEEVASIELPIVREARAFLALRRGDIASARQEAREAAQGRSRRKPRFESAIEPTLTLLLATGDAVDVVTAKEIVSGWSEARRKRPAYGIVATFVNGGSTLTSVCGSDWQSELLLGIVGHWKGDMELSFIRLGLMGAAHYGRLGAKWVARELEALHLAIVNKPRTWKGIHLVDLHRRRERWEELLDQLEEEARRAAPVEGTSSGSERLIWRVRLRSDGLQIEPRLQKRAVSRARRGEEWTAGRAVALARLVADEPFMTDADRAVAATIHTELEMFGARHYSLTSRSAVALVGHPLVFDEDQPELRIEMVKGRPSLRVEPAEGGVRLRLHPLPTRGGLAFERPERGRIVVYELSPSQRQIALRYGAEGVVVPESARDRLEAVLEQAMALWPVEGGDTRLSAAESVPADSLPVVELVRWKDGLRVRLGIRPFGTESPDSPWVDAGEGPSILVATLGGRLLRVDRDLARESAAMARVRAECPSLAGARLDGRRAYLEDPRESLQLLAELEALGDDVRLVWPEGGPLQVSKPLGAGALRLQLRKAQDDWFASDGTLEVDESLVVRLQDLLELLPSRRGRYLPLGGDRFAALTDDLLRRLETLAGARDEGARDEVRLGFIGAGLVAHWAEKLGRLELDRATTKKVGRAREAAALEPDLPRTLEADLRTYQREGYRWMMRLAHWGAGACLADDMGLGKTVQVLAVLLARAELGPTLVVAPTSVVANWADEAARFAPSLRVRLLTATPTPEAIADAGPFDVLVTTHGLLALHIDVFASRRYASAVIDEAQAIKNPSTQRAKAAFRLRADFRILTTGTPIENHLGELWSLMRFLNPGLLGTERQFERRFAQPIQRDPSGDLMQQLRAIVAPFILRRLKRDVLRELPPKTEIVLSVEPSEGERAFSEALRRRALERFAAGGASIESSALTFLSELTRLRLAACHPVLVDPTLDLGSSKLDQLVELLLELREGGHRALVFSQFASFLRLAEARLKQADLTLAYLDGSTPPSERQKAVSAFQSGAVDAFLISLKAGGTGLNLTAADYVVHLDPWWNPAAEDQASDRAHRIGQTRPVTVYRLVTRGSIEERVLALHAEKRDLAERVLEGTSTPVTTDVEALLALIRD